MNSDRLADYLGHIRLAAEDARRFVRGMDKATFEGDIRTQRAIVMSLIIVGEAATKVMEQFPDFTIAHPEVPWRSMRGMRGMRNRIAHGYFETNLDMVWDTVLTALPDLLAQLPIAPPAPPA